MVQSFTEIVAVENARYVLVIQYARRNVPELWTVTQPIEEMTGAIREN
jgi:hypothetical protein